MCCEIYPDSPRLEQIQGCLIAMHARCVLKRDLDELSIHAQLSAVIFECQGAVILAGEAGRGVQPCPPSPIQICEYEVLRHPL